MIDEALIFLRKEIDTHVKNILGEQNSVIQLSPIFGADGTSLLGGNRLGMVLVNIEEERVNMAQTYEPVNKNGVLHFLPPEVRLNLHVLIVANTNATGSNYEEALKSLSAVIGFFQTNRYFTPAEYAKLPQGLEKLVVELETLDYEFQNHVWGTLGGKLLPSVLYRLRLLPIQQGIAKDTGKPIMEKRIGGLS